MFSGREEKKELFSEKSRYINIKNHALSDNDIYKLTALLSNGSLDWLQLINCNLSTRHVFLLSKALAQQNRLSDLNLSGNKLSEDGFTCLIQGLSGYQALKVLSLTDMGMGFAQYIQLVQSLSNARSLNELNLSNNIIGSSYTHSTEHIFLPVCLRSLNLSNNAIGQDSASAAAIFATIPSGSKLSRLTLSNNNLDEQCVESLLICISNNALSYVGLNANKLEGSSVDSIGGKLFFQLLASPQVLDLPEISCDHKVQTPHHNAFDIACKDALIRLAINEQMFEDKAFMYTILRKILENNLRLRTLRIREITSAEYLEPILQLIAQSKITDLALGIVYGEDLWDRGERYNTVIKNFLKTNPPLQQISMSDDRHDISNFQGVLREYNTHLQSASFMGTNRDKNDLQRLEIYNTYVQRLINDDPNLLYLPFSGEDNVGDNVVACFKMYDGHLENLIPILARNTHAERLDLSYNQFTDISALAITDLIMQSKTLKYVDLSNNCFTTTGMEALRLVAAAKPEVNVIYALAPQQVSSFQLVMDGVSSLANLFFTDDVNNSNFQNTARNTTVDGATERKSLPQRVKENIQKMKPD